MKSAAMPNQSRQVIIRGTEYVLGFLQWHSCCRMLVLVLCASFLHSAACALEPLVGSEGKEDWLHGGMWFLSRINDHVYSPYMLSWA